MRFAIVAFCGATHLRRECRSREELDGWLELLARRHYTVTAIEIIT